MRAGDEPDKTLLTPLSLSMCGNLMQLLRGDFVDMIFATSVPNREKQNCGEAIIVITATVGRMIEIA